MPEPSDSDRRKAAQMEPWLAGARLVDALERGWEIHFRCQYCGTTKTWRRDTMLGRARPLLGDTFDQIQRKAACPRCPGRLPILWMSGVQDPGPQAERLRWDVINTLLDAGLSPSDYGYGWRPPSTVARP
jgi:DNA-directed RNA polymerase subunit RPC12/RpoP